MAKEKRMISNNIYDQDEFLDMPHSAIVLYTYLNLAADDEGFVGNTKSVMRKIRASDDDLKILLAKRFVLGFEHGKSVVVIKHWLIHNSIRQDRIKETTYIKEKETLAINEFGAYTELKEGLFSEDEVPVIAMHVDHTLESVKLVIDYLNNKLGTKYKYSNTRTKAYVKQRISEGFRIEDFYVVINTKYDEWISNPEFAKYLNPETLFRPSNFEKYLNQAQIIVKKKYGSCEPEWMNKWLKELEEMENQA